jgi:hypothetical protein
MNNIQMGRHKDLLFAHSRSASVHCSEAPAIPNVLLGMTQLKPLIVKSLCLKNSFAKVSNILYFTFYEKIFNCNNTYIDICEVCYE